VTTQSADATLDDSDWAVPEHETTLHAPKAHAHALVIPVINEGERIRGQLLRIREAGLPVDVIVADGGSTDGSLDPEFVQAAGVRAVLTKTGPGKLSAQLRMAYAWCLREGYAGIVTIDGNGKDGVDAVADMVAKLEEGCDYVQGSRYLPGGVAENTPLDRTIANRLIHAPLLSASGRHWFTDTTNGFRAYSAGYLTHPGVRPFREAFQVYSLLFYLTVRAGQLGLKVGHVPVARRYPDTGKVPTKIGGLSSKLALLREAVVAATGGLTPDAASEPRHALLWPVLAITLLLAPFLVSLAFTPPYSPDSWAMWELSQTVFGDFYRFDHWRSYWSASPYSASFPPLFPVLIAITDGLLATGPRTGLYLAFACFGGFAVVSEEIGRRVTGVRWIGSGAALLLLLGPNMLLANLGAGGNIALQLLLLALLLRALLAGDRIGPARAAVIGLLAGLAILNRFDAVLLPFLSAAMIAGLTRRPTLVLMALAAAAVAVSPWVYYSLTTFGTVFATDNGGIATALDPASFVTDWWPEPQPSLTDDPLAWGQRVAANAFWFIYTGASLMVSGMGLAAAAFLAAPAALVWLAGRWPQPSLRLWIMTGFAVLTALMMAPQIVTGYLEYRYYAALLWAVFLTAACWGIAQGRTLHQRRIFARIAFATAALSVAAAGALQVVDAAREDGFAAGQWDRFEADADVRALQACMKDTPDARILVLGDDNFAARAGALGDLATMMEPRNMAEGRLGLEGSRAFIATWEVDFVLTRDPVRAESARAAWDLERVSGCPLMLYRVEGG
jgi:hypothetical protein